MDAGKTPLRDSVEGCFKGSFPMKEEIKGRMKVTRSIAAGAAWRKAWGEERIFL